MVEEAFRWEAFSGDGGQTRVLSRVELPSGARKCLEDPFNPETEALETLSSSLENVAVLIIPPCSLRTIEALKSAAPELKTIIVADNDEERLDVWRESFLKEAPYCETLQLPSSLEKAEAPLRERLMKFECEIFLGRCLVYAPQRFKRLDRAFADFLEQKVLYLQRESCSQAATRSMWSWRRTLNQLLDAGEEKPVYKVAERPQETKLPAVVVVGAGPSLDLNIKDLKEFSDRAFIISTDAALNTMLEHGVKPDIVACMDSGPLIWRLFVKNLPKLKDVPLAASTEASHLLFRTYPGKTLLFANERPGETFNEALEKGIPKIRHGECVGHFAFHLAESLRPETIVMVGFDLAYRDGKFHSAGMQYKYDADFKKSFESTLSTVEAAKGGTVKTDLSFEFFLRYFEEAIARCKCEVIDATEGGALKKGARIATLRETLSAMPPAPELRFELNASCDSERRRLELIALRESLRAFRPKLAKVKEEAKAMTLETVRNPLKKLDLASPEFTLVSSCASFLLMAEWARSLQGFKKESFPKFKSAIEALSEDLCVCADTIVAALDAASREWPRKRERAIVLTTENIEKRLVEAASSSLAGEAKAFPSDAPLDLLWREMSAFGAGKVVAFDGNVSPELWSVPGVLCFDVKTSFKPTPHDKTLWIPGYKMLCAGEETWAQWRNHAPADVDCGRLEERRAHA